MDLVLELLDSCQMRFGQALPKTLPELRIQDLPGRDIRARHPGAHPGANLVVPPQICQGETNPEIPENLRGKLVQNCITRVL